MPALLRGSALIDSPALPSTLHRCTPPAWLRPSRCTLVQAAGRACGASSALTPQGPCQASGRSVLAVCPLLRRSRQSSSTVVVHSSAASAAASKEPDAPGGDVNWPVVVLSTALVAGLLYAGLADPVALRPYKESLLNGPLGSSGFLAAFSLIFLSEIGDKTFFIAALLAMKLGKWVSFLGSLSALSVMTVISVGIGAVFSHVPDALKSSIPVGEIVGVALLVFFGIKALKEGMAAGEATGGPSKAEEELTGAEDVVKDVSKQGSALQSFIEVATLIFLAEWGDRSMLATIALGAAQSPLGVAIGAIAGHAVATSIAVLGGALAAKYVSERMINFTSGGLFLLFAVATVFQLVTGSG